MPLRIGQTAPNFTLDVQDGSIFTLSDALKNGPVVLIFYPIDNSPRCNQLLCRINDELAEFAEHGYQLVGVNHSEPGAHLQTATRKFLRMPLLSDRSFQVAKLYDSLFEIGPIKVIRYSVVGIDQAGKIKFLHRGRPTNNQIIEGMATPSQA
jgi:peroxiredoxin Q/BCP